MEIEHPPRRFPRADAELKHPLGLDTGGRVGDGVLQLVVGRHLRTDRPEVGGRVEVELVTAGSVDHGCSLAGAHQSASVLRSGSFVGWSAMAASRASLALFDDSFLERS